MLLLVLLLLLLLVLEPLLVPLLLPPPLLLLLLWRCHFRLRDKEYGWFAWSFCSYFSLRTKEEFHT